AGIQGNEKEMLEFADQFGCHSLLLKVICGEINQYPKRPGHFDAWRADANYGAKLKVSRLDLRQSQNHILEFALAGLDERVRKLLCRIAVLSEGMDYDTLAVLNPFLPPKPEAVDEPEHPETAYSWLWKRWTEDEKKKRIAEHEEARDRFMKYLAYFESSEYRQSILAFDEALKELRDRGLLQWDRDTTSYDMHPVVRGYASDFLEDADRKQTFLAARDHFAGLPPDDLGKATELSHVAHSLEIFRCFTGAGLLDDAAQFYCGNLAQTMRDHVCGFPMIVEMLTALFDGSKDSLPCLSSASNQAYILNDMAIAVAELGREDQALLLFAKSLRIDLERKSWPEVATGLRNLSVSSLYLNHRAERAATIALALELAMIAGDDDGVSVAIVFSADDAINEGRFAEGKRLLDDFSARPLPNVAVYRPGRAEYLFCASQFFQGVFSDADWHKGHDTALRHRNIKSQHQFLSLRCEWLLAQDQPGPALDAIDEALKIVNRIGTPKPGYHDLRAWALAKLGRNADARAELANGEQRRYAAEAWLVLDDREQARACVLSGYRRAWADGPPYIHWYELERCKAILRELGEPEPQLPAFDPAKVRPIPYEAEIRAAIAKLKEEKEAKSRDSNDTN
ncbi:MAG TPA: hypothetical protein VFE62_30575, partial [Gemmataceae bacterium]|nr:hypothetical protein [Gemmataceae bacterium]